MPSQLGNLIEEYLTENGRAPFSEWLLGLRDIQARAQIRARLDRLSLGNWGDFASIGERLFELRLFHGPGYRIYGGVDRDSRIVLLCGGSKSSQSRDVKKAKAYWLDYRRRSGGYQ